MMNLYSRDALNAAHSADELTTFLERSKIGFDVQKAVFDDSNPWQLVNGAIAHTTGGFFTIVGIEFSSDCETGVYLFQPQSAITGMLTTVQEGQRYFLLQARAEPGTHGNAQYGPTVQSTPANFLRMHGGLRTPYVDYFYEFRKDAVPFADTVQLDLGRRYYLKSKRLILVECHGEVKVGSNYVRASSTAIKQSLLRPSFFNIDLRSFFAVMPWDRVLGIAPIEPAVNISAALPPRPEVMARLMTSLRPNPPQARFIPLEKLGNWRITERGLFEKEPRQGFSVEIYRVNAPGREVTSWVQPLVNSANIGHAVLYCRVNPPEVLEVLVQVGREPGLSTGVALLPSVLHYPGDSGDRKTRVEETMASFSQVMLARTTESDEGGRFYNDVSIYEIILINGGAPDCDEPHMAWISISELKQFLTWSNFCSIQLRGLASMFLSIDLRIDHCG